MTCSLEREMGMSALRETYLTPEEYLALDRASEVKHEYIHGQVYAMTGASLNHNFIVANIIGELAPQLKNSLSDAGCGGSLRVNGGV